MGDHLCWAGESASAGGALIKGYKSSREDFKNGEEMKDSDEEVLAKRSRIANWNKACKSDEEFLRRDSCKEIIYVGT